MSLNIVNLNFQSARLGEDLLIEARTLRVNESVGVVHTKIASSDTGDIIATVWSL